MVAYLVLRKTVIILDDHREHRLASFFIGYANDADLQYAWMLRDGVLDFVRVDVESRHQDHVFFAIKQSNKAARQHFADIAGSQPTVSR